MCRESEMSSRDWKKVRKRLSFVTAKIWSFREGNMKRSRLWWRRCNLIWQNQLSKSQLPFGLTIKKSCSTFLLLLPLWGHGEQVLLLCSLSTHIWTWKLLPCLWERQLLLSGCSSSWPLALPLYLLEMSNICLADHYWRAYEWFCQRFDNSWCHVKIFACKNWLAAE